MTSEEMCSILEADGSVDAKAVLAQLDREWEDLVELLNTEDFQPSKPKLNDLLDFESAIFINNSLMVNEAKPEVRDLHANLFLTHILKIPPADKAFELLNSVGLELGIDLAPLLAELASEDWKAFLLSDWSSSDVEYFLEPHPDSDRDVYRTAEKWMNQHTITAFFDDDEPWYVFLRTQISLRIRFAFLTDMERAIDLAEQLPLPGLIKQAVYNRTPQEVGKLLERASTPYDGQNRWQGKLVGFAAAYQILDGYRKKSRVVSSLDELKLSASSIIAQLLNWSSLGSAELAARLRWERIWQGRHTQHQAEFDDFIYEKLTEELAKQGVDPLIVGGLPDKGGHSPIERFVHDTEVGMLGGADRNRSVNLPHLLVAVDICCDTEFTGPSETNNKIIELLLDALVNRDAGLKLYGSDLDGLIRAPSREYNCYAYLLKDSDNPVEVFQNAVSRFGPHIHRFRYATPKFDFSALMGLGWWMIAHLHTVAYLRQSGRENCAIELWDAVFERALMLFHMEPRFSGKTFTLLEQCFRFLPHVLPNQVARSIGKCCKQIELTAFESTSIIAAVIENGANPQDVKNGLGVRTWELGLRRMRELACEEALRRKNEVGWKKESGRFAQVLEKINAEGETVLDFKGDEAGGTFTPAETGPLAEKDESNEP